LPDSTATPLTDITQLAASSVWRGHRIDPTGFYYLGARYYEPTSGRFLSPDPKGQAASMSLYDFCNGDPVNGFDPDGRCNDGNSNTPQFVDNGTGPGSGTNISNNDPTTGGQNPNDPNGGGGSGGTSSGLSQDPSYHNNVRPWYDDPALGSGDGYGPYKSSLINTPSYSDPLGNSSSYPYFQQNQNDCWAASFQNYLHDNGVPEAMIPSQGPIRRGRASTF
jgi:RHS repeat-associated protein